jgi:lipoprotein-anchoring transpeptidase ErfK/SrfK
MIRSAMDQGLTRRHVLLGCSFALAGCATITWNIGQQTTDSGNSSLYGDIDDPPFTIPALDLAEIDPSVLRQEVAYRSSHRPGTVVVKLSERRLYLVENGGQALRYGVGVGREEALNFRGSAVVGQKTKWPHWTPTASMIARMPKYAAYAGGLPGGPDNPLGARALYLYRDGHDTFFRLHGTNEPESIGQAVSSGCIRLLNHDIIHLYNRLVIGTPVIIEPENGFETS